MSKSDNLRTGKKQGRERGKDGRFLPGTSGNPGGRPKTPKEIKEAIGELTQTAIETYRRILEDPEASNRDKIRVAQDVIDRVLGKPQQSVALEDMDKAIRISIEGAETYAD